MEGYKREFIKFLEDAGVLKFGDFTAKSGRKIPYFINAGDIKTGEQIQKLGEFYAKAYFEKVGNKKSVLYGPAYKGIPIAVSVAVALAKDGLDVPFFFNRKEEKDHGEGGVFVINRRQARTLLLLRTLSLQELLSERVWLFFQSLMALMLRLHLLWLTVRKKVRAKRALWLR